jgi:hypothetical protein
MAAGERQQARERVIVGCTPPATGEYERFAPAERY